MYGSGDSDIQDEVIDDTPLARSGISLRTFQHHKWSTCVVGGLCLITSIGEASRNLMTSSSHCTDKVDIEPLIEYHYDLKMLQHGAYILGALISIFLLVGVWQEVVCLIKSWIACDVITAVAVTTLHVRRDCSVEDSLLAITYILLHMFTVAIAVEFCQDVKKIRCNQLSVVQVPEIEPVTLQFLPDDEIL